MSWAKFHVEKLQQGETVSFRPKGNSMKPKIHSGDLVTVSPETANLGEGDIVLCKVKGVFYVHLVTAVKMDGESKMYLIGNNKGHINGWIGDNAVFGRVTSVEH